MSWKDWERWDDVPMWWPPKMDDHYRPDLPLSTKIGYAIGGWLVFTVIYGGLIFGLIAMYIALYRSW